MCGRPNTPTVYPNQGSLPGSCSPDSAKTWLSCCPELFKDQPGFMNLAFQDIDGKDSCPVMKVPYKLHPLPKAVVTKETETVLWQGLVMRGMHE